MVTKIEWVIYKITSKSSSKSYIGITKQGLRRRWLAHVATANRGRVAMSRAIRKYGPDDFDVIALAVAPTFEEAAALERALIGIHGTLAPLGYNLTTGGEATHGRKVSEEARLRMSASAKARTDRKPASVETRARISAGRKAIMSPEMRHNIGAAHRGKIMSPETRAKLRAATLAMWERHHAEGFKRRSPRR